MSALSFSCIEDGDFVLMREVPPEPGRGGFIHMADHRFFTENTPDPGVKTAVRQASGAGDQPCIPQLFSNVSG